MIKKILKFLAVFLGTLFGARKLHQKISPKKIDELKKFSVAKFNEFKKFCRDEKTKSKIKNWAIFAKKKAVLFWKKFEKIAATKCENCEPKNEKLKSKNSSRAKKTTTKKS